MVFNGESANKVVDGIALLIAMAVDIMLGFVFFWAISANEMMLAALSGLAFLATTFKCRALWKGHLVVWACFAVITFTASLSMVLAETKHQTVITSKQGERSVEALKNDAVYASRQLKVDQFYGQWLDLQEQYKKAVKRETMDELSKQIAEARRCWDDADALLQQRYVEVTTGTLEQKLTADAIFYAIPEAVAEGRLFQLFFFAFIFFTIEATIFSILRPRRKDKTMINAPMVIAALNSEAFKDEAKPAEAAAPAVVEEVQPPVVENRLEKVERIYLGRAWPIGSEYVLTPEAVAAKYGTDLNICKRLHEKLFGGLDLAVYRSKCVPNMSREKFLRLRREQNAQKTSQSDSAGSVVE